MPVVTVIGAFSLFAAGAAVFLVVVRHAIARKMAADRSRHEQHDSAASGAADSAKRRA